MKYHNFNLRKSALQEFAPNYIKFKITVIEKSEKKRNNKQMEQSSDETKLRKKIVEVREL